VTIVEVCGQSCDEQEWGCSTVIKRSRTISTANAISVFQQAENRVVSAIRVQSSAFQAGGFPKAIGRKQD
jgi:hypothetical protein